MRIHRLEIENFKRLKSVAVDLGPGVTRVVGRNGQGKSSFLDAVIALLGGKRATPDVPVRVGEDAADVKATIGDLRFHRRITAGGTSTLTITAPDGNKYATPQAVCDQFITAHTFNPLSFERMKPKEQATVLAGLCGIDVEQVAAERKKLYDERTELNRRAESLSVQLGALIVADGTPDEPVSVADLLEEMNAARTVNDRITAMETSIANARSEHERLTKAIREHEAEIVAMKEQREECGRKGIAMAKDVQKLARVDINAITAKIADSEAVNEQVRRRKQRDVLTADRRRHEAMANDLTSRMKAMDADVEERIAKSKLPVKGLKFDADGVTLASIPFAQCSSSDRLRTSMAIGAAMAGDLRLMLSQDGPLLDADGMKLLEEFAEKHDMQVLIERIAGPGEVGVVIEDGEVVETAVPAKKGRGK